MSIEEGLREIPEYQEITDGIEQQGYYTLPAGTVVDIKLVSGIPLEVPILDTNNNITGKTAHTYDNTDEKVMSQVELADETMVGGIFSHSFETGDTELMITSHKLVEAQTKLDEWLNSLAKKYEISDQYIDEEHEEKNTGPVDISLYIKDHPEVADEIQEEEKKLTRERNEAQAEAEMEFLKKIGIQLPEDKTLLRVSLLMKTK